MPHHIVVLTANEELLKLELLLFESRLFFLLFKTQNKQMWEAELQLISFTNLGGDG